MHTQTHSKSLLERWFGQDNPKITQIWAINYKEQQLGVKDLPNEVGDDEELDDTIDDANGPALHHHRLGGLIGEEVCDTRPHAGSGMQVSLTRVSVSLQWFHLSPPHPKRDANYFKSPCLSTNIGEKNKRFVLILSSCSHSNSISHCLSLCW